jgi:hypothetical protein
MSGSAESAARARAIHLSRATPEQLREQTHNARIAAAVKAVVDRAPELTPEQITKLRAILAPEALAARAPQGGGAS